MSDLKTLKFIEKICMTKGVTFLASYHKHYASKLQTFNRNCILGNIGISAQDMCRHRSFDIPVKNIQVKAIHNLNNTEVKEM